jgi:hypothetical protein
MKQLYRIIPVTAIFLILPSSVIGQNLDLSGNWVLDREESVINSASGLMGREDFAARPPQAAKIPGMKSRIDDIPGNRPDPGAMPKERPEGNFPGRSNWEDLDLTLIITQSQEKLKITHRYTYEFEDKHITQTFSLDGSQDQNVMRSGRGKYLSETTVEKDKIVNQGRHEISEPTGNSAMPVREEYSLSSDGETLILRANRAMPEREISATMVFRRVPEASE